MPHSALRGYVMGDRGADHTEVPTADEMRALGARVATQLRAGDLVVLAGGLGAGKTTFVQGLARGLGVPPDRHVASPTFALVNEHPGRVPLVHADLSGWAPAPRSNFQC